MYIYALISTDSLFPNENKVSKCTWRLKKPALNYNKTMLIWYLDGKFFHMYKIPKTLKFVDYCVEEFSKTYCGIMSY